jgi:hypothetical protein
MKNYESFTSNSVTFIAVPLADPNSPRATITYPNNDTKTLNFTLNNNTTTYNLTNTNTTPGMIYYYKGSDQSTARLIILPPTNSGPDSKVRQMFVITNQSGGITSYGSYSAFVDPSGDSSNNSSNDNSNNNYSVNPNVPANNNFDNYNHFDGSISQLMTGTTYYGPNGSSVTVKTNSDGKQILILQMNNNSFPIILTTTPPPIQIKSHHFYGPNNEKALIIKGDDGQQAIKVETSNGVLLFTSTPKNQNESYSNQNQSDITSTQYYGSTGYTIYPYQATAYTQPNNNEANMNSNQLTQTNMNQTNTYSTTLPPGIPRSQIPPGQEDLYILKSEVVPPVCPACPAAASCPRQEPCPPCPACARCPEPSFECKKVPNYNSINSNYLPVPVLADFSTFGM